MLSRNQADVRCLQKDDPEPFLENFESNLKNWIFLIYEEKKVRHN